MVCYISSSVNRCMRVFRVGNNEICKLSGINLNNKKTGGKYGLSVFRMTRFIIFLKWRMLYNISVHI